LIDQNKEMQSLKETVKKQSEEIKELKVNQKK